jgi:integrase
MKTRLNQKLADRLPLIPEGKKSVEYRDIDMPNFLISQYHTNPGVGTFTLRYRDEHGRQRALKIGRTDEMSLKQAKAIAKTKKSEIALGADPQREAQKKRDELTYTEAMEQYYLPDVEQRLRRPEYYKKLFNHRIKPEIGHKKLNSVTRADVQSFHSRLGNEVGAAYANRHIQIIKASYNFFINVLEIAKIRNPAVGLKLFDEVAKDRILTEQEVINLIPVLMEAEGQYKVPALIIRFLLATALRRGECFNLRWSSCDLVNKRIHIESSSSKNRRSDAIPINLASEQVLSKCARDTDWPFCNPATRKPYTTIKKAFKTLMDRAGIEGVTIHDLRRTAGSMVLNAGGTLLEVQRLLRHSSPVVTEKHYARLTTQTLQKASDSISDQLMKAAEPKEESNVIPLNIKASGEN